VGNLGKYDAAGLASSLFHSIQLTTGIIPTALENLTGTFNEVFMEVMRLTGANTADEFNEASRGYMSQLYYKYLTDFQMDNYMDLFSKTEDGIAGQLKMMQERYPDNLFLDRLMVDAEHPDYNFIKLKDSGKLDKRVKAKLIDEFRDLAKSEPAFAETLIKYAFYSTGFNQKIGAFNDIVLVDAFDKSILKGDFDRLKRGMYEATAYEINKQVDNVLLNFNKAKASKVRRGKYLFNINVNKKMSTYIIENVFNPEYSEFIKEHSKINNLLFGKINSPIIKVYDKNRADKGLDPFRYYRKAGEFVEEGEQYNIYIRMEKKDV